MNLPALIRATAKTWGKPAQKINEGDCDLFAGDVVDYCVSKGEFRAIIVDDTWFTREGEKHGFQRHAWVWFDGRHYDSECPEGTRDWMKLPFFRRCVKEDVKLYGQREGRKKIGRIGTPETERVRLEKAVARAVAVGRLEARERQ